jgi:hypothetical protein
MDLFRRYVFGNYLILFLIFICAETAFRYFSLKKFRNDHFSPTSLLDNNLFPVQPIQIYRLHFLQNSLFSPLHTSRKQIMEASLKKFMCDLFPVLIKIKSLLHGKLDENPLVFLDSEGESLIIDNLYREEKNERKLLFSFDLVLWRFLYEFSNFSLILKEWLFVEEGNQNGFNEKILQTSTGWLSEGISNKNFLVLHYCSYIMAQCMVHNLLQILNELKTKQHQATAVEELFEVFNSKDIFTLATQSWSQNFNEQKALLYVHYIFHMISMTSKLWELATVYYLSKVFHILLEYQDNKFIKLTVNERLVFLEEFFTMKDLGRKYFMLVENLLLRDLFNRFFVINGSDNDKKNNLLIENHFIYSILIQIEKVFRVPKVSFYSRHGNFILTSLVLYIQKKFATYDSNKLVPKLISFVSFMRQYKLGLTIPKKSLLGDSFLTVFYFFVSREFFQRTWEEIFQDNFLLQSLTTIAEAFNVPLTLSKNNVFDGSLVTLLLPLVWNLGNFSFDAAGKPIPSLPQALSLKGLQCLSVIHHFQKWSFPRKEKVDWNTICATQTANLLKSQFLCICTHFMKDSENNHFQHKSKFLNCLSHVVELMSLSDLLQFLPKVSSVFFLVILVTFSIAGIKHH